jgi:hypothetical protein
MPDVSLCVNKNFNVMGKIVRSYVSGFVKAEVTKGVRSGYVGEPTTQPTSVGLECELGLSIIICWIRPGRKWSAGKGQSCRKQNGRDCSRPLLFYRGDVAGYFLSRNFA